MKKFILAMAMAMLAGMGAFAQTSGDQKKFEFFAGYSYGSAVTDFNIKQGRADQHGFNGAVVYKLSRYFGIKGDVSGTYGSKRETFLIQSVSPSTPSTTLTSNTKNRLYNFLGGIQVKDNASEARVKPFAHALVGAAYKTNELNPQIGCLAIFVCPGGGSKTGFAGAFGGGLDVRINKKVDFRAIQVDYNPASFDGGIDNNMRIGIGIVFR
jgi:hypothetical protein